MNYTPQARAILQRMPANTASAVSKNAERVARAMGRSRIGKDILEIVTVADDKQLEEFIEREEQENGRG